MSHRHCRQRCHYQICNRCCQRRCRTLVFAMRTNDTLLQRGILYTAMMGQVQYSAQTIIAETIPNSIHHGLRRHAHVMFMPCECPLIWPHVMHTHMSCHANMSCNVMPMSCSWHANAHSYAHTSYTLTCNVMPTCHAMSCPCHVHGMRMPTHMPTCHAHSHVMPCQNVMQRHAHVMFMACECPLICPHVMHTHMHAHISC